MSWPGRINDKGGIRNQFHHVIDIVPTILEATGIPRTGVVDGIAQKPIEGVSMAYTFDKANADAPSPHRTQYFEMMGDRALYHDGWIAEHNADAAPWELLGKAVDQTPPARTSGNSTTCARTGRSPTTCRGQVPGQAAVRCRNCSWWRPPTTRCCRWMPRWRRGS